jgi:hypothetical protein
MEPRPDPNLCDYCGERLDYCPCGLVIHWDTYDCPHCGKKPRKETWKTETTKTQEAITWK